MTKEQQWAYDYLTKTPAAFGRELGYKDLRDDLHGDWIRQMLFAREDVTLQAHRGSYKTTCLTIAISILMMTEGDENIIFMRKTGADVVEVIKQIAQILLHPWTQTLYAMLTGAKENRFGKLYGGKKLVLTKFTSNELSTSCYRAPRGAAQLLGIGTNGSMTGKHSDKVFTDDIVNLSDRSSRAEREHTKAIYQELQNIRNRGGRIFNTGTPWHKDDAFTIMPKPMVYDCYQTNLITDEKLDSLRRSMAPSLFAANYELRHIAAEDALFSTAPVFTADESVLRDGIAHVDASYGGEDFTAFTCGKRVGDTIYLYGKLWHRHVDIVLDAILGDVDRLMCSPVYCEDNGDKGYLRKEIIRRDHFGSSYTEHQNKVVKISTYLRKWWSNIVFLEGTDPDYIAQIMDYTIDATHDDAPDSASCICRILDKRGDSY